MVPNPEEKLPLHDPLAEIERHLMHAYLAGGGHDVESCITAVRNAQLRFAGLQYYGECWGGGSARYGRRFSWRARRMASVRSCTPSLL